MANYSFKMQDVGEGIVEVEINRWLVAVGDFVEVDQAIADVMTDKANVEITTPVAGKVLSLASETGAILAVGAELALIEQIGDSPTDVAPDNSAVSASVVAAEAEPQATHKPVEHRSPEPEPQNLHVPVHQKPYKEIGVLASPAVRRRAREADVELRAVPVSDSNGRVTHQDLDAYIAGLSQLAIGGLRKVRKGTKQLPLKGLRRAIAKQMQLSKQNIPHYTYVDAVDITDLTKLRKHLNDHRSENQHKLTLLPFLMLAMVRAIFKFPLCNAHFDNDSNILTRYDGVHIGMATMTEDGLKVPVLRHVEAMDIWHCASEIQRLANSARDNTIARAELSGSTITLTSLGTLGGLVSTPIINQPEVSIIGVNKAEETVVVRDGEMVIRTMMNLSSSFDHRVVDGHTGASFVQQIRSLLEHPATLFL